MANVKGPFFSTWASGSVGKILNVRACFSDSKFVMAMHKQRAGKRHAIQIFNSNVFRVRMQSVNEIRE